jgi:hypothetical protein
MARPVSVFSDNVFINKFSRNQKKFTAKTQVTQGIKRKKTTQVIPAKAAMTKGQLRYYFFAPFAVSSLST